MRAFFIAKFQNSSTLSSSLPVPSSPPCSSQDQTFPLKIKHVVLNPPPHLLRVTSKYLLKTLLFHLERIFHYQISENLLLSVLHFLCLPLLLVPLKIQLFHFKWLRRDPGRSLLKFYQSGPSPSRVFHSCSTSQWLQNFSLQK